MERCLPGDAGRGRLGRNRRALLSRARKTKRSRAMPVCEAKPNLICLGIVDSRGGSLTKDP
jgi:hypothetical protein